MIWYSHLFQNFPQFIVVHTVKAFGIVNKAEVDVFLELCCFFSHPADVGNLISGSSAFSKSSLNIWKFMVHVRMSQIRAKKCLRINVGTHCLHVGRPCYLWMEFCSTNSSFSEQSFFFFFAEFLFLTTRWHLIFINTQDTSHLSPFKLESHICLSFWTLGTRIFSGGSIYKG